MTKTNIPRKVRNFLDFNQNGFLSTISNKHKGYPFGSITPYDTGTDGCPVIFISLLAEHYKNFVKDSKGCLTIPDWYGHTDPQLYGRLSVLGTWAEVPAEDVEDSYWARFPDATERALAHNFRFYKCTPTAFRWIGGFGEIHWVQPEEVLSIERDNVAYSALPSVRHMNEDHRDAVRDYLKLEKLEKLPKESELEMTYLDKSGFNIRSAKQDNWFINFKQEIKEPSQLRGFLIKLLGEARG